MMREFRCNECKNQCNELNRGDCVVVKEVNGVVESKRVCVSCSKKLIKEGWREVSRAYKKIAA